MKDRLRRYYKQFISFRGDPRLIALGFAIGVLIGFFPVLGTHTALVVVAASFFRVHMASAFVGSWIAANPLTMPPMLMGEYYLGRWLLNHPQWVLPDGGWNAIAITQYGWEFFSSLLVGGLLLGLLFAAISYPVIKTAMIRIQTRRAARSQ